MDTRPPQTRNLSDPDETLSLEKGSASTVRLGEMVIGRLVLEPGWRWSEHVRPTAGTTSCQFHHVGLAPPWWPSSGAAGVAGASRRSGSGY